LALLALAACNDAQRSTPAPSGEAALDRACAFRAGVSRGTVQSRELTELSGIAASRRNPGVLWAHNDKGNASKVFAVGTDGRDLGAVGFGAISFVDTEDIAVGAGPDPQLSYVYVGDIGDNNASRAEISVYRFAEPQVSASGPPLVATVRPDVLRITYSDGPHDAEALLFDPIQRELLLVTKSTSDTRIYRVAAAFADGDRAVAERVATLATVGGAVSGGDISPAGDELILRTDRAAMSWRRDRGATIAEAVARPSCAAPAADEPNGEALAFAPDGRGYFTVSEGQHQPLFFYARSP
jgi:hypothetical protein